MTFPPTLTPQPHCLHGEKAPLSLIDSQSPAQLGASPPHSPSSLSVMLSLSPSIQFRAEEMPVWTETLTGRWIEGERDWEIKYKKGKFTFLDGGNQQSKF